MGGQTFLPLWQYLTDPKCSEDHTLSITDIGASEDNPSSRSGIDASCNSVYYYY